MIFDNQTIFSSAQAITVTAASTNVIDLGPIQTGITRDVGKGTDTPLLIQVTEAFTAAGAATLTIDLQTDSVENFATPKTVWSSGAIGKADLVAGKVIIPEYLPRGVDERYVRLNYTVATGPMLTGKIVAGITMGNQSE